MRKILGASIGSCVHVAGIMNFLNIAQKCGFETKFLGKAVDIAYTGGEPAEDVEDYLSGKKLQLSGSTIIIKN